jgi:hypothetical protein
VGVRLGLKKDKEILYMLKIIQEDLQSITPTRGIRLNVTARKISLKISLALGFMGLVK